MEVAYIRTIEHIKTPPPVPHVTCVCVYTQHSHGHETHNRVLMECLNKKGRQSSIIFLFLSDFFFSPMILLFMMKCRLVSLISAGACGPLIVSGFLDGPHHERKKKEAWTIMPTLNIDRYTYRHELFQTFLYLIGLCFFLLLKCGAPNSN